jgi:4,5-DOPA dioxygenase extradiol
MNAVEDNPFTRSLKELGETFTERPRAIMVVSAHWLSSETFVNTTKEPDTIYDFYGFPRKLYEVKYPASGAPEVAKEVMSLVPEIKEDRERGLDHGVWTVLKHIFPKADIPVFQLSIAFYQPMEYHYSLAQKLKALRDNGVLVIGSGNVVHNLALIFSSENNAPYDWALKFDEIVKDCINNRDFESLVDYVKFGKAAKLSVPTVDHYVPLLYTLGMAERDEPISYPYEEVFSSLSMRCVRIGL